MLPFKLFRGCMISRPITTVNNTRRQSLCSYAPQILQRQCDRLQSTTTNMELEVEGNSQSTTAMKNRVRLLRKESRKQVTEAEIFWPQHRRQMA